MSVLENRVPSELKPEKGGDIVTSARLGAVKTRSLIWICHVPNVTAGNRT